jgi:hypothetical protein
MWGKAAGGGTFWGTMQHVGPLICNAGQIPSRVCICNTTNPNTPCEAISECELVKTNGALTNERSGRINRSVLQHVSFPELFISVFCRPTTPGHASWTIFDGYKRWSSSLSTFSQSMPECLIFTLWTPIQEQKQSSIHSYPRQQTAMGGYLAASATLPPKTVQQYPLDNRLWWSRLNLLEKEKSCLCGKSNPAVQPVTSHHTVWAIQVHRKVQTAEMFEHNLYVLGSSV